MALSDKEIVGIATEVVRQQRAFARPVLTLAEAQVYCGFAGKSRRTFQEWLAKRGVRACAQARYARQRLDQALNQEAKQKHRTKKRGPKPRQQSAA